MKISGLKDRMNYWYTDKEGLVREFPTLSRAVKSAQKYSQNNPDYEINICCSSSIYFLNGDLEF